MPTKCWGIGLGRTGTNSLCEALRILGIKNVHHNPQFEQLWQLDGGADNGVTLFYKYLDYKFPGSKFVLTMRDVESWLHSMQHTSDRFPVGMNDDVPIMRRMIIYESVTFDRSKFITAYHRHHEDVRRYFCRRQNDLLEIDFSRGNPWEKLCPFLGLPIPAAPFPVLNRRIEAEK
jgi:hypothetical protein